MKFALLAAAAMIAAPVMAQTTPSTGTPDQSTVSPTVDPNNAPPTTDTTPATDAASPMPMQQSPAAPMGQTDPAMTTPAAPTATTAADPNAPTPAGGYQPSGPALTGNTAGGTPRFQPAPTPDQAYPAPAPLAKYPVCKKGQYDKCIQRGGR